MPCASHASFAGYPHRRHQVRQNRMDARVTIRSSALSRNPERVVSNLHRDTRPNDTRHRRQMASSAGLTSASVLSAAVSTWFTQRAPRYRWCASRGAATSFTCRRSPAAGRSPATRRITLVAWGVARPAGLGAEVQPVTGNCASVERFTLQLGVAADVFGCSPYPALAPSRILRQ